jgi:hypothetical protein
MTMAALGHVLAASVKTIPAVRPTTYKIRIGDLPETDMTLPPDLTFKRNGSPAQHTPEYGV